MKNKSKLILFILAGVFLSGCSHVSKIPNAKSKDFNNKAEAKSYSQESLTDSELEKSLNIYKGVTVNGIDISDMNRLVAVNVLKEKFEKNLDDKKINFKKGDDVLTYSLRDLGYSYDYDKATKEAFKLGRGKSAEEIKKIKENPVDIKMDLVRSKEKVDEIIASIKEKYDVAGGESYYVYDFENGKVVAKAGDPGKKVDQENLVHMIHRNEKDGGDIELPIIDVQEEPRQDLADRVNGTIGSAESTFNRWFWARAENIRVSTEALNGAVIGPGETFSVNSFIGDTTPDKGYQEAVVIVGDKEVPGYGGGVCQTSTCLYQAVLKADLEVILRYPHTMLMSYSPGGLDSTIEYGQADLVFKNPYDFPIVIKSYYEPGYISFSIEGDTNTKNYNISIFSELLDTTPAKTEYIDDDSLEKELRSLKFSLMMEVIIELIRKMKLQARLKL